MSTINEYIKGIGRRYPNTKAVREQIEELRDTLHLKTEEFQSQGKTYEQAACLAIESIGDISALMGEVSGNIRTIYVNRLSRNNVILSSSMIFAEFLIGWIVVLSTKSNWFVLTSLTYSTLGLIAGIGVWVAISVITWKREPKKIEVLDFRFRRQMRMAVIGWLCLSFVLLGVNLLLGYVFYPNTMWFQWPVIGIANWPLNIWLYHRQLTSGKYDAK